MTAPVKIEMSIGINAVPELVWPHLVDWENLDRWMREASGFKVTSRHLEGIGVTALATIRIAGITTIDPVRVTRWDPPRILEIEHMGWVSGKGLMQCNPEPWGTNLSWRETLVPPLGPIGALGLRILKPLMQSVFQGDLELLKKLVETVK